jgi:hypothetical protein
MTIIHEIAENLNFGIVGAVFVSCPNTRSKRITENATPLYLGRTQKTRCKGNGIT